MVLSFAKASSSLISHSPSVFIREGNDTPLQCSCLENPRDRGSLVSCRLWGHTELDTTEVMQQQQQQLLHVHFCSRDFKPGSTDLLHAPQIGERSQHPKGDPPLVTCKGCNRYPGSKHAQLSLPPPKAGLIFINLGVKFGSPRNSWLLRTGFWVQTGSLC